MSQGELRPVGVFAIVTCCILVLAILLVGPFWAWPKYRVWQRGLEGEAELRKAEFSKKVRVEEAKAKLESATLEAEAEAIRAKGVAEANQIIGSSLKGNEAYIRYLWVTNLSGNETTVYIPTAAGLPVLEAGRFLNRAPAAAQ